jgi:DNA-binding transcriptional LysR family regulator
MDIEDVRTFVSLATTRSFSRTAQELYLTQPGVTRRLQRLEGTLGAVLVDRARRPLRLTAAGLAALERCRDLLDAVAELRSSAGGPDAPASEMRLGVAHALTEFALLAPVERLRRERAHVRLLLTTGWSHDLLARVKAGLLDAAALLLAEGEALPAGLSGEAIASERLVPIAPRARGARRARSLSDLKDSSWILNPEGCAARAALERAFRREDIPMRVIVETYTYDLQISLVAQGQGYGLVPQRILARSPSRAGVTPLPLQFPGQELGVWLVQRPLPSVLDDTLAVFRREVSRSLARRRTGRARHPD